MYGPHHTPAATSANRDPAWGDGFVRSNTRTSHTAISQRCNASLGHKPPSQPVPSKTVGNLARRASTAGWCTPASSTDTPLAATRTGAGPPPPSPDVSASLAEPGATVASTKHATTQITAHVFARLGSTGETLTAPPPTPVRWHRTQVRRKASAYRPQLRSGLVSPPPSGALPIIAHRANQSWGEHCPGETTTTLLPGWWGGPCLVGVPPASTGWDMGGCARRGCIRSRREAGFCCPDLGRMVGARPVSQGCGGVLWCCAGRA